MISCAKADNCICPRPQTADTFDILGFSDKDTHGQAFPGPDSKGNLVADPAVKEHQIGILKQIADPLMKPLRPPVVL